MSDPLSREGAEKLVRDAMIKFYELGGSQGEVHAMIEPTFIVYNHERIKRKKEQRDGSKDPSTS